MLNIGIIGAGGVGSTAAFALIMRGVARKVVLIDQNAKRAEAEAEDIAHATPFAYANKIKAGTYKDLENTDVVIITAGANQKPGETRNDLLATNVKIFESIIPQLAEHAPNAILVNASNPMDVMTSVAITPVSPKTGSSAAEPYLTQPASAPCSATISAFRRNRCTPTFWVSTAIVKC